MTKDETLAKIQAVGLLSVLRGPSEDLTIRMVDALVAGGVTGIEITYSTPNAPRVVKRLHEKYGDAIVLGMGTLTTPEHATAAKDAGASFIVSPHTDPELAAAMTGTGLACMFGALTPTEIMLAMKLGADVAKIFPGSLGGPAYMKALKGPLPDIAMMPTGGVKKDNVKAWFDAGAFAVGAGSALCPKTLAQAGDFDTITKLAREFVDAVAAARA